MVRFLASLILIWMGSVVVAASAPTDFSDRWIATPRMETVGPNGLYQAKLLRRYVVTGGRGFSVGTIVYLRVPKAEVAPGKLEVFDPQEISRSALQMMGFRSWWRERRQGSAYVFESPWKKVNRFLRIYVREDEDGESYHVSVALYRDAYADRVALESELLQRELMGVRAGGSPDWLERLTAQLFSGPWGVVATAHAQTASPPPANCDQNCAPGDVNCFNQATSCNFNNLAAQLNALNQSLQGLNTQGQQSNSNWQNSNQEINQTRDVLEELLEPKNLFLTSAVSAAGATLGAIAMSGVFELFSTAVEEVVEMITGARAHQERLAHFKRAREKWEKLETEAARVEAALDSLLWLRDTSVNQGVSREDLVVEVGRQLEAAKSEHRIRKEELDEITSSYLQAVRNRDVGLAQELNACRNETAFETAKIAKTVAFLQIIQKRLPRPGETVGICQKLYRSFHQLAMAEGHLQHERSVLSDPLVQEAWEGEMHEQFMESADRFKRAREGALKIYRNSIQRAEEVEKRSLHDLEQGVLRPAVEDCMCKKAGFMCYVPVLGGLPRYANAQKCYREFVRTKRGKAYLLKRADAYTAKRSAKQAAQKEYASNMSVVTKDKLYVDPRAQESMIAGYKHWFNRIKAGQTDLQKRLDSLKRKKVQLQGLCNLSRDLDPDAWVDPVTTVEEDGTSARRR